MARQNFQTLHQRQSGIDHDGKLAEENRDVLGLDLAAAEGRQDEFLALFPDRAWRDALAAQLRASASLLGAVALAAELFRPKRSSLKM